MPLQVMFSKVAKPFNYSYIHLSRTQFGLSRQTDKKAKTNLEDLLEQQTLVSVEDPGIQCKLGLSSHFMEHFSAMFG